MIVVKVATVVEKGEKEGEKEEKEEKERKREKEFNVRISVRTLRKG